MQAVCDRMGCDLPDDVIVSHGPQSAVGHESGHGELERGEPVVVDIWPRDRASRCWADMTRTFVAGGGEPPDELAEFWRLARESLDLVYPEVRAGADCRALFARSCEPFHAAGQATQLTKEPGTVLEDGYFHGLGHGVGLEIHERPLPRPRAGHAAGRRRHLARAGLLPAGLRRLPARGPGGRHGGRLRGADGFPVRPVTYPAGVPLPLLTQGKVRELYELGDDLLMVASDRISTYDVVHPTPIPDKGKVLTGLSVLWFGLTADVVPNHLISATDGVPDDVRGRALRVKRLRDAARGVRGARLHHRLGLEGLPGHGPRLRPRAAGRAARVRAAAGADLHADDEGG